MLDEVERSLHDALCVVKRVMECNQIVAGGGAVEAALSIYLENFATSLVRFAVVMMYCMFCVLAEFQGTVSDRKVCRGLASDPKDTGC